MKILVTGGSGFVGSALIRHLIQTTTHDVLNVDKLTYAGNPESLLSVECSSRYAFERLDICDFCELDSLVNAYRPDSVIHLAAESHVDKSIVEPGEFIQTNIVGTYNLLEIARHYWRALDLPHRDNFRFHHVSTDEVYGDLDGSEGLFREETPYAPSSPYSASKAASDHLVRAWYRTFGLPVVVTNCSNNYGPYQFPEKLIPMVIVKALLGQSLPVFGSGTQVRDWLFVEDHARALVRVVTEGTIGESYNIGGHSQKQNIEVVRAICSILDELRPSIHVGIKKYHELITFVTDRPGHDVRYAIDASKIQRELDWVPQETFESGLRKTVEWYLTNEDWWQEVLDGASKGQRLGQG